MADIPAVGNCLRISPVIRSYPGALVVCKRLIAALTSVAVKVLIGDAGSILISGAGSVSRMSSSVGSGVCG